ncbi:hypothetical protein [Armatimonas rosea]|uniref:Uncharacterized protein n=1 Tax=Armatimonas rosea TaxID=685828 RepID=A0A7W9SVD0_ARMRO|nr:hypothetical protein [Armatimonas rosea]MBB6053562.1 hypothetical protein [Armatimonas rosea]
MNQSLNKKQVIAVILVLLALASLTLYRYFKEPVPSSPDLTERPLQGTTVASLNIIRGALAPPRLVAKNPNDLLATPSPQRAGEMVGGVGDRMVTPEEQKKRDHASKQHADALTYLKQAGVSLTADEPLHLSKPDENPIEVFIWLKGTGTAIGGRPSWGTFGYKVEAQRTVYLSRNSDDSTHVTLEVASGELGIATPETLAQKQDEALGKALEALTEAWKRDNPAPKTPR